MESSPIFFITGAPATGKSTLSKVLLSRFPFGIHVPVDELRELVVSGIAHPVGWTDETTRQFRLAEQSACDLAVRYQDAGFAVAVDHCQGPPTLDALIAERLQGRVVHKIALFSSLETNLRRNRERTNKTFDHTVLIESIEKLSPLYRSEPIADQGWVVFSNEEDDVEAAVDRLLSQLGYSITK